jgi:hypothetical protein
VSRRAAVAIIANHADVDGTAGERKGNRVREWGARRGGQPWHVPYTIRRWSFNASERAVWSILCDWIGYEGRGGGVGQRASAHRRYGVARTETGSSPTRRASRRTVGRYVPRGRVKHSRNCIVTYDESVSLCVPIARHPLASAYAPHGGSRPESPAPCQFGGPKFCAIQGAPRTDLPDGLRSPATRGVRARCARRTTPMHEVERRRARFCRSTVRVRIVCPRLSSQAAKHETRELKLVSDERF